MVVSDFPAAGEISARETVNLRGERCARDRLKTSDMGRVFRTAREPAGRDSIERMNLMSEAVAEFAAQQNDLSGCISQQRADWLMAKLREAGGIATASEFTALIDMMKRAPGVPPSLSAFALREIETAIVNGRRDAIGGCGGDAGTVTKADVEALRAVLCAATSDSVSHVTREEAEALFGIAHATANAACDPSFDDLFACAVGNYLTALYWHEPILDRAFHRERWLDKRESVFLLHPESRQQRSSHELKEWPLDCEKEIMTALERQDSRAWAESEQTNCSEANWVLAHLVRQGPLTSAETRLLQWLHQEAHVLPPELRVLIEGANDVRAWLSMNSSFLRGTAQSPRSPQLAH